MMGLNVLKGVWGKSKGYAHVPLRKEGKWNDGPAFSYPDDWDGIKTRIREGIDSGCDVYWCPTLFTLPTDRKKDKAIPPRFLWADLDKVNPDTLSIKPTVAWKSSDHKYQALWLIDETLPTEEFEELNKSLTYHTKADRGGWAVNKVLRVPGTTNYKYDPPQEGCVLWVDKTSYKTSDLKALVAVSKEPSDIKTPLKVLEKYDVADEVLDLLNYKDVTGLDRSKTLYYLEHSMLEAGVPSKIVFEILWTSPWNKFKDRKDGRSYLLTEILEAEARTKDRGLSVELPEEYKKSADEMSIMDAMVTHEELVESDLPDVEWIVEDIIHEGSTGMVAGHPKSYKSMFVHDLALSVASGVPFLDEIKVHKKGRVVYFQGENNSPTMRDRSARIEEYKGLSGKAVIEEETGRVKMRPPEGPGRENVYYINQYPLDLTKKKSRQEVELVLDKIKPLLFIIDPFYMVSGGADENSAKDISDILRWMTGLRNKYSENRMSILLVHHLSKAQEGSGRAIRGSGAFHGWYEAGIFLTTTNVIGEVKMNREYRSSGTPAPLYLQFDLSGGNYKGYVKSDAKMKKLAPLLHVSEKDVGVIAKTIDAAVDREMEELLGRIHAKPMEAKDLAFLYGITDYDSKARGFMKRKMDKYVTDGWLERRIDGKTFVVTKKGLDFMRGESEEDDA